MLVVPPRDTAIEREPDYESKVVEENCSREREGDILGRNPPTSAEVA